MSTKGIRERGLAWSWNEFLDGMITARILKDSITNFEAVEHKSKHAFLMTLPKAAYPLLLESSEFIKGPQYSLDTTFQNYDRVSLSKIASVRDNIQRVGILADLIERGLLDWMCPARWRRYSFGEAARAIEALDDVQLVVDNILSSEWENRSVDARFLNPKGGRQPDETLILERELHAFAFSEGLQRWIDPVTSQPSDLWVVPIPGGSEAIVGTVQRSTIPMADLTKALTTAAQGEDGRAPTGSGEPGRGTPV
jgi:hypothetical protein